MSISYKVVQNHNWTIESDSVEGNGTSFNFCLPIKMKKN
jgi:signal transduction histidine kinase